MKALKGKFSREFMKLHRKSVHFLGNFPGSLLEVVVCKMSVMTHLGAIDTLRRLPRKFPRTFLRKWTDFLCNFLGNFLSFRIGSLDMHFVTDLHDELNYMSDRRYTVFTKRKFHPRTETALIMLMFFLHTK